jgi:hypothetical protein
MLAICYLQWQDIRQGDNQMGIIDSDEFRQRAQAAGKMARENEARVMRMAREGEQRKADEARLAAQMAEKRTHQYHRISSMAGELAARASGVVPYNRTWFLETIHKSFFRPTPTITKEVVDQGWVIAYHITPNFQLDDGTGPTPGADHRALVLHEDGRLITEQGGGRVLVDGSNTKQSMDMNNYMQNSATYYRNEPYEKKQINDRFLWAPFTLEDAEQALIQFAGIHVKQIL